jgi:hypothetical protein
MAPHECNEYCLPSCSLKGIICLQNAHRFSVVVTNIAVSRDRQISIVDSLNDYFSQCGRIVAIRTTEKAADPDVLEALITFSDKDSACKALDLNNSALGERIINVHCALDVDISHLVHIPPITFTERFQENVQALKETVRDTYANLPPLKEAVPALKETVVNSLPDVKEAVMEKAHSAFETMKDSLSSAYETVASYVGGEGQKQTAPPQAVFGKPAS